MSTASRTISFSPPAVTKRAASQDDSDSEEEEFRSDIASAKSSSKSITRLPVTHFKFSSAETEANTNANSYFGNNTPLLSPSRDYFHHLGSDGDVSDIEGDRSRSKIRSRSKNRSRSRSRAPKTSHWGTDSHFVDPNSPSAAFAPRVAFDTFDNKNATDFSLTLQSKHEDYQYTRLSRTFLCGTDKNKYSENAVTWLLEQLVEDGDEIVCLRVLDPYSSLSSSDEKAYRAEAHSFLEHIMTKNTKDKKISLILEFTLGSVESMIKRMIQIYEPAVLVVGTKGRSREGFKGLLPGSVSKWCLQHSPIPVVVVKPVSKRESNKAKREANPNKLAYIDLIASHPDEPTKVYDTDSSLKSLAPQIPAYLKHSGFFMSAPTLSTPQISQDDEKEDGEQSERLGRFDRIKSRSP